MTGAEAMSRRGFQVVVAATRQMGIGLKGALPWKLPGDMRYFKELTMKTSHHTLKNAVIMGRMTWESIPERFRPLAGRINIVLTRNPDELPPSLAGACSSGAARVAASLDAALESLTGPEGSAVEHVFVIGGGQVYEDAIRHPSLEAVHLTQVDTDYECDTHFPALADHPTLRLWSASAPRRDGDARYHFLVYTHHDAPAPVALPPATASRHEEYQYLDMIREVIDQGAHRPDRTGTGTLSVFGRQMRFNLRHSFPLLTTKRVFWRGLAEELLWFVAGETNAKKLADKGVHIWDGNGSKEFLANIGLGHREEGDLGPVYGFQWRHFNAPYSDCHADYSGQGVDQLAQAIQRIKDNPTDRRLVVSAWNPVALPEMALPPCHMFFQFYVADGELSCQMYQRSCDLGLGVPFNIASYALLTRMVAQVCGLAPGDFVHVLGDAHVYDNHVEPLKEQLKAHPKHFPQLRINSDATDIDGFKFDEFELREYRCGKKIAMKMAV
ncbi:unnamed protein product [Pedinophyceae sp. YPF-701]|nr:unnamed protein product [Pedinophyceae sp. YPF-701]